MGLFISMEGPDGSGKSTQVARLVDRLRAAGLAVTATREPGGTPLGDSIRTLLLDSQSPAAIPLAMAMLLSASRAQLVEQVVIPALSRGDVVVVDRYADSTVAYQGYGFGLDVATVETLSAIATAGVRPDRVVYIDVPPDVGLRRTVRRGHQDRLDAGTFEFYQRVRDGYHRLAASEPDRWVVIDGQAAPERVERAIMEAIAPLLQKVALDV